MPAHMRQAGGVGPRAMHRHASVAHNPILNGASVISGPFIGVELTSWKAPPRAIGEKMQAALSKPQKVL